MVPFSLGQLQERRAREHAGVIDEDVDTAQSAMGFVNETGNVRAH
jgi:hypothetical protein